MKTRTYFLLICIWFAPVWGLAQEESWDDLLSDVEEFIIVVTASKHERKISETPASVSVLTADQIKRSGARTVPQALRFVVGLDVAVSSSMLGYDLAPRGLNREHSNRVLIMIDNRPIYNNAFGFTEWDFLPISLNDIARIEVIRGPGSCLYGANAFAGVINIITRYHDHLHVMATFGDLDTQNYSLSYGGRSGNLQYSVTGIWDATEGWGKDDDRFDNDYKFIKGNFKLKYHFSKTTTFSIESGLSDGEGADGWRALSIAAEGLDYTDQNYFVQSTFETELLGDDQLKVRGFVYDDDQDRGTQREPEFKFHTTEIELQYAHSPLSRHYLTYGVNYREFSGESPVLSEKRIQELRAGYVQDEVQLSDRLQLIGGFRYDDNSEFGSNISPRISLLCQPKPQMSGWMSYSEAFQAPNMIHSYLLVVTPRPAPDGGTLTIVTHGDKANKPELLRSIELGLRAYNSQKHSLELVLYYNRITDLIAKKPVQPISDVGLQYNADAEFTYYNVDGVSKTYGLEVEVRNQLTTRLTTFFNFTLQDFTDNEGNHKQRMYDPKYKANFGLNWNAPAKISADIYLQYVDERWGTVREMPVDLNSYFTTDIRLGKTFSIDSINFDLDFTVSNLFEDKHYEVPSYAEVGRQWWVRGALQW